MDEQEIIEKAAKKAEDVIREQTNLMDIYERKNYEVLA